MVLTEQIMRVGRKEINIMDIPKDIPIKIEGVLQRVQKKLSTVHQKSNVSHIQMKNLKEQDLFKCPLCNGTGLVYNSENNRYKQCQCMIDIKVIKELQRTGLNTEALNKSFKEFISWNEQVKNMKDIASNYYIRFDEIRNKENNSLALLGESGVGKTHLLIALIRNFITTKHLDICYMSYTDNMSELKQNMLNGDIYQKHMNRYKKSELLVIDDLFKGSYTEADIRIILEIINHRYLNKLPFMLSSELFISDFIKIDKALGGRIAERTKGFVYEVRGIENNYRLKKVNGK